MTFSKIGVIGAGVMGVGVAQDLAQCGLQTVLLDVNTGVLDKALKTIADNVRLGAMLNRTAETEPVETVLGRITPTVDYAPLAAVDFVVENVVEKPAIKEPVYHRLDAVCPPHCVFAVNTSAISITRVAGWTNRPAQVVGMHFMNPVPMKKLVEVIRGFHTSDPTIETARAFLAALGKKAVVVNDMPGFVSNRVLMLTVNEAVFVVQDQVASAADVDKIFKGCFGHKMGPLETADLIGLDTILYSLEVLYESYNDPKFRPAPLLKKMVDAGLHGRKSGRGFYQYPNM
ncbi:MAG: 3-hydroxybutyryl-CoA dehydrogenase [Lentisphaerae bacterium RIFOXYC12_FULL_60_16]|nr:MAG: 3-hydroxybutyryl-CoA dehydrogenase [Lentisphaerae bacterium RIFOXYC12_FULL_60_16]OGV72767.1 MAG: 3-hydroxybutyryl-CoA dehydrogenase [Lentisphaerae bacterium RIFOXYA12_FULL_60_10]OGV85562.1 MAG: 3-hydroxybutyryl-CoA dehydrogenase [Lentisphaerae bacterium RIFOXYB12_FULL_60_10]